MRSILIISVALSVITVAVYLPVGTHQFLNLDDNLYVTHNPHVAGGLTGENMLWAFTALDYSYWHPVTWLSHMADVQLYGMNPAGHHLTNVGIHLAASLLLLLLLLRTTGALWQSSFVAALFALHPLHVESVAWVAERKDVLSGFFWFLTLFLYARFQERRRVSTYLLALLSFLLGLMSKPMLVTLPVVMLLMDYWPLDRFSVRGERQGAGALMLEKLPFFICSLLSCIITLYGQSAFGAMADLHRYPFLLRVENALVSYLSYVTKSFWPRDLAVFYPFPSSIPLWQVIGSSFILAAVTAAVLLVGRRRPYLLVGWSWFLVTLLPVIGLTQVGSQAMADRFVYIPGIGLFIMVAWGIPPLLSGMKQRRIILATAAGGLLIACIAATWHQIGYWKDNVTLYRHSLEVTSGNILICGNLGTALVETGDPGGAIPVLREAIRINPDFAYGHHSLGIAYAEMGAFDEAIGEYREALRLTPRDAKIHYNLGVALSGKGELDGAVRELQVELSLTPDDGQGHYYLGTLFAKKGYLDGAVGEYRTATTLRPDDLNTHIDLGIALQAQGDPDAAILQYRAALRINPGSKDAHNNLGIALIAKGELDDAIREFREVLSARPDDIDGHGNLGAALARKGELDAAIVEFRQVLRVSPHDAYAESNLARALAGKQAGATVRK